MTCFGCYSAQMLKDTNFDMCLSVCKYGFIFPWYPWRRGQNFLADLATQGIILSESMKDTPEQELLRAFVAEGQETAFEELVRRHASMVMGVCRRTISNPHDAEEAFQAAFLILARKAASIRQQQSIGSWLYRVAMYTALKARARAASRTQHQISLEDNVPEIPDPSSNDPWAQVRPILDEELNHLPEKFRSPLVLCYLEGRNYDEAARELGLSHTTLKMRLQQARDLLCRRLVRQGVTLSAAALGTLLTQNASATVTADLISSTVHTSTAAITSTQTAASGATAASVAQLAKDGLSALFIEKIKMILGGLVVTGGVAALAVLLTFALRPVEKPLSASSAIHRQKTSQQASQSVPQNRNLEASPSKNVPAEDPNVQLPNSVEEYVDRFKEAAEQSSDLQRWAMLRTLGIRLSDEDFAAIEKQGGNPIHQAYHAMMIRKWVEMDPLSAANYFYRFQSFPIPQARVSNGVSFYNEKGDPWSGCPSDWLRWIVMQWVQQDRQEALSWAQQLPKSSGKMTALGSVAMTISFSDPQAGLELFQSLGIQEELIEPTEQAAGKLASENPQAAIQWVQQLPEGSRSPRGFALYRAVAIWAGKDLKGALQWAEDLPPDSKENHDKLTALLAIALVWGEQDVKAARDYFLKVALENSENEEVLGKILMYQAHKDPKGAMAFAEKNLPEGKMRSEILRTLILQQASNVVNIADTLEEAISSIQSLPEEYRDQAFLAVTHWEDPQEVVAWLKLQPAGSLRDRLFQNMIFGLSNTHKMKFEEIVSLANEIGNEIMRSSAVTHALNEWLHVDPTAAAEWITASPLSKEMKEKLLRKNEPE